MPKNTTLAVIALILAPSFATAQDCGGRDKTDVTASSCVVGTVWDAVKGACIAPVTG